MSAVTISQSDVFEQVLEAAQRHYQELLNQAGKYEKLGMPSTVEVYLNEHLRPLKSAMDSVRAQLEKQCWQKTGWWRVTAPDGSVWCEASSEKETRDAMRLGDTLWFQERSIAEQWTKAAA